MKVSPEPQSAKRRTRKHRSSKRWRLLVHFVRYLRACLFLLNLRTLILSTFACMMVYLCQSAILDLRFRMEFSIVSVGTVFPLVFSIQQAFSRREEALRNLSIIKGTLMGTYFCHRDWDVSDGVGVRANLGNDLSPHAVRCARILLGFITTLKMWLSSRTAYESESEWRMLYGNTHISRDLIHMIAGDFFFGEEDRRVVLQTVDYSSSDDSSDDEGRDPSRRGGRRSSVASGGKRTTAEDLSTRGRARVSGTGGVAGRMSADGSGKHIKVTEEFSEQDPHWQLYYRLFESISKMSVLNEELMVLGNCTKAGEAGLSRLAAYLSKTVEVLERLRCLREYRTPFMLRYVSLILVITTIIMAAPYFAFMCVGSRWEDDYSGACPAGYLTAIMYVLVVCTLFNVQVSLENPFDGIGMDDVLINMDREFAVTISRYARARVAAEAEAAAAAAAKMKEATLEQDNVVKVVGGGEAADDVSSGRGGGGGCPAAAAAPNNQPGVKEYAVLAVDEMTCEAGVSVSASAAPLEPAARASPRPPTSRSGGSPRPSSGTSSHSGSRPSLQGRPGSGASSVSRAWEPGVRSGNGKASGAPLPPL